MEKAQTYKGHDTAELRRIFRGLHDRQDWRMPRTQAEYETAAIAVEFCAREGRRS